MQQPLLTVLIPVYNAEKYLKEAIESMLKQTLTNFELLIINDASTDKSINIIKEFKDERIRLVSNEKNMGISKTLNKGIDLATTELIARMDADDISHPIRLQQQYNYFMAHPDCALLSCTAQTITQDKEPLSTDDFKSPFYYYNLIFECWIYHPTVMYKKSAVLDVGGYSSTYSEDFDLWWHLSRKYKIAHLPEVLLDYRLTDESLCKVTKKKEYESARQEQVIRNIKFYAGNNFELTENELACLQHNFDPILAEQNINSLICFFQKLDLINACILNYNNINADKNNIKQAAFFKKKFILNNLSRQLTKTEKLWLYMRTGNWQKLHPKKIVLSRTF